MTRRALAGLVLALWPGLGAAGPVDDLTGALRLPELAMLMRAEGVEDANALVADPATGRVPQGDMARLETIFDPEQIQQELRLALAEGLSPEDIAASVDFFDSPAGQALVELELVARSAMVDEDIEEIVRAEWAARRDEDSTQVRLIRRFAQVNDLVERNVTATLTARYHYLRGLAEGAGNPYDDAQILSRVWSDEPAIREDTEGWLMGYLLLAYGPADPGHLQAYVDFSRTPAGQAVNVALFEGFDVTYGRISYGLGLVTGRATLAQDL
ncbi:MAG: hypothetical protein CML68_04560 [Rhodobacteraceae bacterium]|nr:hypothetical protein [Paracoccaceae bacterium]